jgi:hypothetical protein
MAIIWADDFSSYGTSVAALSDGVYAEVVNILMQVDPAPTNNIYCIRHSSGGNGMRYVLPAATATVGYAGRFWFTKLPDTALPTIIQFRNASNIAQVTVEVTSTGALQVRRGFATLGTVLGISAPVLTANAWNHVEAKVFVNSSTGTVGLYVNGNQVLALTGINTLNSGSAEISQVFHSSLNIEVSNTGSNANTATGLTIYRKDAVYWDGNGTRNNDVFGPVSVIRLGVQADSSFSWTPSSGTTGWNLIDETGPDDLDYVTAATPPPAASAFTLANLPPDVTSVRGLISMVRAKNTDGGDGKLQVSLTSGGSNSLGVDRQLTTANTYYRDVSELSPATGVAWTPAEVDAATIKLNRTL